MTNPQPIRFLRVQGIRSHQPSVVAIVDDDIRVKWNLKPGWLCDCDEWHDGNDGDTCPHVEAVAALLDPRVLGDAG
jgi:hypothetical protein